VLDEGAKETRLVTVKLGLAAQGFVEVTPIDGSLEEGDQVVVSATTATGSDTTPSDTTPSDTTPSDPPATTETTGAQG
jgi:hypothetical protein